MKPVFYKKFSLNNINFLMQLVDRNGFLRTGIPFNMSMTYKTICISSGCDL